MLQPYNCCKTIFKNHKIETIRHSSHVNKRARLLAAKFKPLGSVVGYLESTHPFNLKALPNVFGSGSPNAFHGFKIQPSGILTQRSNSLILQIPKPKSACTSGLMLHF